MEKSSIQDKELILRVLSMYQDPETREREIKNIASAFTAVAEQILPRLRRSMLVVNTEITGKTDEELRGIARANPGDLTADELLHAATLFQAPGDKIATYNTAARLYPADWRTHNDAGAILLEQGDITAAKAAFTRAATLDRDNKTILNNLGAIALIEKNLQQAAVPLGNATGAGAEVEYNKGILAILSGDYSAATRYLAPSNTINAALANILVGNYNEATRKLASNNSPLALYLKAVTAARTNNTSAVINNLEKAIALDPAYKQRAVTDLEFAAYLDDPAFAAIVR